MTAINICVRSWMFFHFKTFLIEYAITFNKAIQYTSPLQKSVKFSKSTVLYVIELLVNSCRKKWNFRYVRSAIYLPNKLVISFRSIRTICHGHQHYNFLPIFWCESISILSNRLSEHFNRQTEYISCFKKSTFLHIIELLVNSCRENEISGIFALVFIYSTRLFFHLM